MLDINDDMIKILMLKGEKGDKGDAGQGVYDDTEIRQMISDEALARASAVSSLESDVETQINALDGRVTANEGNIGTNTADIADLTTRLDTLSLKHISAAVGKIVYISMANSTRLLLLTFGVSAKSKTISLVNCATNGAVTYAEVYGISGDGVVISVGGANEVQVYNTDNNTSNIFVYAIAVSGSITDISTD